MSLCPFIRRASLILNKTLTLSSLVLATMLLSSPAARAGYWTYVVTGDNNGSHYTDNGGTDAASPYSPASSGTGIGVSIPDYSMQRPGNWSSGVGCSMTATVNVQVTFTWHPDPSLPSDPPPPNVLVLETAGASWAANAGDAQHPGTFSGSATNGLGNPESDSQSSQFSETGVSQSFANYDQNNLKGEHLTSYPASSGTVSIPKRTLTATATTTYPASGQWYYGASVGVNYSAKIHPQPYNFRQLGAVMDNGDGTLSWNYVWNSTSGTLSDIGSGCTVYEYVSYDGNSTGTYVAGPPAGYIPPHPPIAPSPQDGKLHGYVNPTISPNPTVPGGAASAGAMNDTQDKPQAFAPSSSLVGATWTATQTYKFDDTATGEKGTVVPGPGAGPMTITRRVYLVGQPPMIPTWYYTVNKSGTTSTPLLLP